MAGLPPIPIAAPDDRPPEHPVEVGPSPEQVRRLAALGYTDLDEFLSAVEAEVQVQTASNQAASNQEIPVADPVTPAVNPAATPPAIAVTPTPAPIAPPVNAAPPGAPPQTEDRAIPPHIRERMRRASLAQEQKYGTLNQQYTAEQAKAAALQQQLDASREEMRIKLELASSGVAGPHLDYAWFALSNQLKTLAADKTPEGQTKLQNFAVQAWAEEQKKTQPYIFGQMPTPANTGAVNVPATGAPPTQPSPTQVAGSAAGGQVFDARTAPPQAFNARMRELGINYSGAKPTLA